MMYLGLCAFLATSILAQRPAPGIDAKLIIPDTTTLPGVPFDMWIDVQNRSDVTITIGLRASFLIRTQDGSTIEIGPAEGIPTLTLLRDADGVAIPYLDLAPGAKQTLPIPIERDLEGPLPFWDARLSPPGRYGIGVRLDRWPNMPAPAAFLGSVYTDDVTIDRTLQNDSDKKVWQRMLELSKGRWTPARYWPASGSGPGNTLHSEILTKYPDSNYVPYALLAASFGSATQKHLNLLLGAIQRFPTSPVIELLHLDAYGTAITTHNLGDVYQHERAAVQAAKRPTTRLRAFGREDVVKPCPPEYDCEP